jgi:hypothetical protein
MLGKALGEYEKKATTDAGSKFDATTPLLDKARGEYEELTKRIRGVHQPPIPGAPPRPEVKGGLYERDCAQYI